MNRGRPPIGEQTPVRLGESLQAAADARAGRDGVSRAEVIRRALYAYLSPEYAEVGAGVPWMTNRSGALEWLGTFDYPIDGDDISCEDWFMAPEPPNWDAPAGELAVAVSWHGNGGGSSKTMSLESAEALGRSLLGSVAVHRLAARWGTSVPALVLELTGELDPPRVVLAAALRDQLRLTAALARLADTEPATQLADTEEGER